MFHPPFQGSEHKAKRRWGVHKYFETSKLQVSNPAVPKLARPKVSVTVPGRTRVSRRESSDQPGYPAGPAALRGRRCRRLTSRSRTVPSRKI
eukprot:754866-Hanusia_phi.AAC.5